MSVSPGMLRTVSASNQAEAVTSTTSAPSAMGARPRSALAVWCQRVCDGSTELLWLVVLVLIVATLCVTAANALPGIEPFEEVRAAAMVAQAVAALMLVPMVQVIAQIPAPPAAGEAVATVGRGVARTLRRLVSHLGLVMTWRRAGLAFVVAAAAAILEFGVNAGVTVWSDIPRPEAVMEDPRRVALDGAPRWAAVTFLGLYAAPWEELLYRGALLVTFAAVASLVSRRLVRWAVGALLLVVTSIGFGLAHADFSALNVVTAGMGGLVYGSLALGFRSVWPAIVAHATANVLVGLVWTA